MFTVSPYNSAYKQLWNEFVAASRNGTFILNRDYMDYHSDRFKDASLLISNDKHEAVALFAASAHDCEIRAHGGLTYGGFILPYDFQAYSMVEILDAVVAYYRSCGFTQMLYKPVPHFYHRYPCEEDIYALFCKNAILAECNLSTVIPLSNPLKFNQNSQRNLSKAVKSDIAIRESSDYENFWNLLSDVLFERHNAAPVHSLEEISQLKSKFPESIKLYVAEEFGTLVAGTVLYITDKVAHCQYIASSPRGFETGALAALFSRLIHDFSQNTHIEYFDFGTSNENHGLVLNEGLIRQKYGFGGRGVAYPIYRMIL